MTAEDLSTLTDAEIGQQHNTTPTETTTTKIFIPTERRREYRELTTTTWSVGIAKQLPDMEIHGQTIMRRPVWYPARVRYHTSCQLNITLNRLVIPKMCAGREVVKENHTTDPNKISISEALIIMLYGQSPAQRLDSPLLSGNRIISNTRGPDKLGWRLQPGGELIMCEQVHFEGTPSQYGGTPTSSNGNNSGAPRIRDYTTEFPPLSLSGSPKPHGSSPGG